MADAAVTIIGAGVVGLAIAAELSRDHSPLYVLESAHRYGQGTSSRNSEVIHAGIYYPLNSLKARLCLEGNRRLYELCTKHNIPHRRITKIITATDNDELNNLNLLLDHGVKNGVELRMLTASEVLKLEPNIASMGGILSPSTGIISAHGLMDFFYRTAKAQGTEVQTHCEVVGLEKRSADFLVTVKEGMGVQLTADSYQPSAPGSILPAPSSSLSSLSSEIVINAAGLECDTIAHLAGIDVDQEGYRLHWAKGSYFAVRGAKRHLVSRLIYPMPPKESLGVHAVVDLGGGLRFGPDVDYLDRRTLDYQVDESKRHTFGEAIRRIVPAIQDEDLAPDMSGIRPKLQEKGESQKDFIIQNEKKHGLDGLINLIGIDSPGLTASPAIATYVRKIINGEEAGLEM